MPARCGTGGRRRGAVAELLGAPTAFITLVDDTRSFWKSCIGLEPGPGPAPATRRRSPGAAARRRARSAPRWAWAGDYDPTDLASLAGVLLAGVAAEEEDDVALLLVRT